MGIVFDGKKAAQVINDATLKRVKALNRTPSIVIVYSGEKSHHINYTKIKKSLAENLGIEVRIEEIPSNSSTETYRQIIEDLSHDTDGLLIQLPLAGHLDTTGILNSIPYEKDVEGLSAPRIGEHSQEPCEIYSPVAKGVLFSAGEAMTQLKRDPGTQSLVLVGLSNLIGKPLIPVLSPVYNSVTICRSHTKNLDSYTKNADVIVAGTGKSNLVKPKMIKKDAVLIDASFEILPDGKIAGDVGPSCSEKAAFFTPVPGGIGPLTVAFIFDNLLSLIEN